MDDKDPPTATSQLLLTPLMISMIGIVSTALAILLYNFILNRFFRGRAIMMPPGTPEMEKGTGVEEKVLESIPTLPYTTEEGGLFRMDQIECPVCLGEFEEGEVVRLLPSCKHIFHVKCIDEWFLSHSNCPVCRSAIVAPVMSSEHSVSVELNGRSEQNDDVAVDCFPEGDGRSNRLRSMSVALVREGKVSSLQGVVKRSMSLDFSYLAIKIQRDNENDSSSSSSMSKKSKCLDHVGSSKRFDRVSSLLTMSCTRLQSNPSDDNNVILPQ